MSEILDKMDLGIDADNIINQTAKRLRRTRKVGKEIIWLELGAKMVRNLYKAKNEVKQLICDLTGESIETVNKMNVKDITEFFNELAKHEGLGIFYQAEYRQYVPAKRQQYRLCHADAAEKL